MTGCTDDVEIVYQFVILIFTTFQIVFEALAKLKCLINLRFKIISVIKRKK